MKIYVLLLSLGSFLLAENAWSEDLLAQIQQVQGQVSQLQIELQEIGTHNNLIGLDTNSPLGALSSPNMAYALLQEQNQYPAYLTLGADVGAALQAWGGSHLTGVVGPDYPDSGTTIAATSVDLYTLANINTWTEAFTQIEWGLNAYPTTVSEAFINFGNLNKSPFYASLGLSYLPFGDFPGDGLVTDTLETNAFLSNEISQIDFGFSQGNFNMTLALFNGLNNFNDFVYSLQDGATIKQWAISAGAGYMNDIRYSGSDIGAAYGTSHGIHNISTGILQGGANGAVDLNANATYNFNSNEALSTSAEWIGTTNSALVRNIATGIMQAWTLTSSYTMPMLGKATTFSIDYSATVNMQFVPLQLPGAINQPSFNFLGIKNQWIAYVQSEVVTNVYVGPEFSWLQMYNGAHAWESALDLSIYI